MGWMILGYNLSKGKRFLSSSKHEDWLWVPPSFLLNGQWGSFCEMKWLGHEDDGSPPCTSSADNKNDCSSPSAPHMCLHSTDRDNATFTFISSCIVRPTYNANQNHSN